MEHQIHSSWNSSQSSYPTLNVAQQQQDDYLTDFKSMSINNSFQTMNSMPMNNNMQNNSTIPMNIPSNSVVVAVPSSPLPSRGNTIDSQTLQELKVGFAKMMSIVEKLEQRMQKVEQTTALILKNQQEVFQVPFMSQSEIDQARQAAELLERDSSVAKQLQAAYNKEVEVKKNLATVSNRQSLVLCDCPICGIRVNANDIEAHVDNCLEQFSNDPKKEQQIQDAKKKMDQGFFSRFMKTSSSSSSSTKKVETTTKVITKEKNSATAPLLSDHDGMIMNGVQNYYNPQFQYPPFPTQSGFSNQNHPQMMVPMYMYPSYPNNNQNHD